MPDILKNLCSTILAIETRRPLLVAVDGVDGSGKSTFARALAEALSSCGRPILQTSVDFFHYKESVRKPAGKPLPKSFFEDSYNYAALAEKLLDPLSKRTAAHVFLKHFDHRIDAEIEAQPIAFEPHTILVLDGIFLHRDELRGYWDYSIFLDVNFEETYRRMATRDGCPADPTDARNARYYQGQLIYLETCDPRSRASAVFDNNDFLNPTVIS